MSVINRIYHNYIIINIMFYTFVNLREFAYLILSANTLTTLIIKCIGLLKIKSLMLLDITFYL